MFVAHRTDAEQILTRDELAEFTRRLWMLSPDGVERTYNDAYKDCRFDGRNIPPATSVQQLVAAWKVMRKFGKR